MFLLSACLAFFHFFFFFNDTATTEIYTLSLHDALPISIYQRAAELGDASAALALGATYDPNRLWSLGALGLRSEEHTSELQSRQYLVCRLLLEKKKMSNNRNHSVVVTAIIYDVHRNRIH